MCQALAHALGLSAETVYAEVERRVDVEGQQIRQEMVLVSDATVKALQRKPEAILEGIGEGTAVYTHQTFIFA